MPKVGMVPIRRDEILSATLRCAARGGLGKLTLESIAREAGISKGIVSYYFKNKQDVLLNAYKSLLESYNRALKEVIPRAGTMKELFYLISDMFIKEETIEFIPGMNQKDFRKILIQFYGLTATNEKFRTMILPIYQDYLESFSEIIREGIKRKEFCDKPDDFLGLGILAMMDGLVLYNIMGFSLPGVPADEAARKLIDLWLD